MSSNICNLSCFEFYVARHMLIVSGNGLVGD